MAQERKTFTLEELAAFDGKEGRPAYVAHGGKVLDVSGSKLWKSGRHMNRHQAGLDLTADLQGAPHGVDVLSRCPQVGVVAGECAASRKEASGEALPWLLRKSPFLRRHPHPMTVHFPIAFATGAVLFLGLYLATGAGFCANAVHAMNLLGALFTPLAFVTGLATWKYNYGSSFLMPIKFKLALSPVLMLQFAAAAVWWMADPAVLAGDGASASRFSLLVASMLPVMGVVGWFGATLTFPAHD
jgi:predicted heme/steroid binding protein/uncharacterized membrane protein